jgi:hypothetical protein
MDNSSIVVDERLWEAYRNTIYAVSELGLELEIGIPNITLQNYLAANGFTRWAFITACNPGSVLLDDEQNAARHELLRQTLMQKNYLYFEGYGQGKTGDWPPETSFFVLEIDRETAKQMGKKFGQLAIVFGEWNAVAELLSLV